SSHGRGQDAPGRSRHGSSSDPREKPMKAYLLVTVILFAVIVVAHVWEFIDRRRALASDILVLAVSAALSVGAWRLSRQGAGRRCRASRERLRGWIRCSSTCPNTWPPARRCATPARNGCCKARSPTP